MDDYKKIAIDTDETSLISLHKKILSLLERQPKSSRRLIEQLIDYYQKIILCMPGNAYWMDRNSITVGCNQKVLDMFGLKTIKDFQNLSFEDMARIGQWTEGQGQSFKLDTEEVISSSEPKMHVEEPPIPDAEGNLVYFLSSRMPLFNKAGDVIGIVGISTDITKQKATEQALAKANKVKTEFLANLSHDIRTPLASIIALTETLNNRIEQPELKEYAFDAQSCAEEVLMLIDEILEITEIDLGKMQKDEHAFSLASLFESIKALMKSAAEQKGLNIKFTIAEEVPEFLVGKRQLLHRILLNLLSNAVKFTKQGSITIDAQLLAQNKNDVRLKISVTDTGIGIPISSHEQIFEQFERLSASYKNEFQGRGLGLYIVKQFVTHMQGQISVESQQGKGSKFSLSIPFQLPSENQKKQVLMEKNCIESRSKQMPPFANLASKPSQYSQENVDKKSKNNIKVLLVEDTHIARKAVQATLAPLIQTVDCAETGAIAITKACSKKYDLILLDIGLPDISGLEVARKIRAHEAINNLSSIPIIALTAHVTPSATQQCINSGIQQMIRKPLTATRANTLFSNWLPGVYQTQETAINASKVNKVHAELYQKFIIELPKHKKLIAESHKANNRMALKDSIHVVHGMAQYLNLFELQKICNSLESAIIDEFSNSEIDSLYYDLMSEIELLVNENRV